MFELYDVETNEKATVFGVKDDVNGYPNFLVMKGKQWVWRSAKYYSDKSVECKHEWIYVDRIELPNEPIMVNKYYCAKCGKVKFNQGR